jgi:hypothetical protein
LRLIGYRNVYDKRKERVIKGSFFSMIRKFLKRAEFIQAYRFILYQTEVTIDQTIIMIDHETSSREEDFAKSTFELQSDFFCDIESIPVKVSIERLQTLNRETTTQIRIVVFNRRYSHCKIGTHVTLSSLKFVTLEPFSNELLHVTMEVETISSTPKSCFTFRVT